MNAGPTVVEQVVERGERQLLLVAQGQLRAWVEVPDVGATVGSYVLLGRGNPRYQVEIPELGRSVDLVIDIPTSPWSTLGSPKRWCPRASRRMPCPSERSTRSWVFAQAVWSWCMGPS